VLSGEEEVEFVDDEAVVVAARRVLDHQGEVALPLPQGQQQFEESGQDVVSLRGLVVHQQRVVSILNSP
jgi:hypothetical protein